VYEPLNTFLLRAPLLAERDLGDVSALLGHRLGGMAIALASPSLARAAGAGTARALARYARRAAFRTTPQGLLAGVCVGELGDGIRIATGRPAPALAPSWARMAALGRALLDDPAVRGRVRVRAAPSVVRGAGDVVRWIGPGDPFGETRRAELDARLAAVLAATARWASWPAARRAAGESITDDDADELLLVLIDDGLLVPDVVPPLVGPPPAVWMRGRLRALGCAGERAALDRARAALDAGDLPAGRRALAALPGGGDAGEADAGGPEVQAVLVLRPRRPPRLPRAAIERAAALAPLLFALQEALAPPAAERAAQASLSDALDATTEIFGAGALDLEALAGGAYGVDPAADDDGAPPPSPSPPARIVTTLAGAIVDAAARGRAEAALDAATIRAALGDREGGPRTSPPPTAELFVVPAPTRGAASRRALAGTGWLLGLHAPAGASWGRFAGALGAPLDRALAALAAAERAARPSEERLDVAFAPSAALADLCTHPRVRARTLALTAWSDGRDLAVRDLELTADPAADPPLALRDRNTPRSHALEPSPLWRVRSATAPAGVARMLAGWNLWRQHAPWALTLGPLAALPRIPRISIDGFVVAPASWVVPDDVRQGRAGPGAVARWRRAASLPRWVQVGDEDRLLPVDLQSRGAAGDLRGARRAFEIWPPLGSAVDRDGRRVEAVVALVDRPADDERTHLGAASRAVAAAGRVAPPREQPAWPGWRTLKLFGPSELEDTLLVERIGPVIRAARAAREIRAWFFIRYVEGPGRRPHLRVRVRGSRGARVGAAFDARLEAALAPARAAGALASVERTEYQPERSRFGPTAAALAAAHGVFESDSDLACALLAAEAKDPSDRPTLLVLALDALARGLGLDLAARHALARARRNAEEAEARAHLLGDGADEVEAEARAQRDREFRSRSRALRAGLGRRSSAERGARARALANHAARTARAMRRLRPAARAMLAPALLHLCCVRHAGPDRDAELDAYTFWERALEGLLRGA